MQSTTHQPMENNIDRRMCASIIWPPKFYSPSTLILSTFYPTAYLYLSERLNNSLLNESKGHLLILNESNIAYTDASQ